MIQLPDFAAMVAAGVWTFAALTTVDVMMPKPDFEPAHYLSVRTIEVPDAAAGEPVPMQVDRTIGLPFLGSFAVVVRREVPGGWLEVCSAESGPRPYRPDAVLPDPVTLDWWTNGRCGALQAGRHVVETVWTMRLPGGEATVEARSNIFEVHG